MKRCFHPLLALFKRNNPKNIWLIKKKDVPLHRKNQIITNKNSIKSYEQLRNRFHFNSRFV